nr:hypothetical protein [Tanacetum cinerariifolium]
DNCYNDDIFNMFTQEEQYTKLLESIPGPHQVQQNDSNVTSVISSVEQGGRTIEQHPANFEETRVQYAGQNVRNQVVQNAVQNPSVQNVGNQNGLIVVLRITNQNGNGNVVVARAEGNANRNNGIQLQAEEFDLMAAAADLNEIEEVNANLMANLQQALTSGTQSDKAPVYDSDGSAEVLGVSVMVYYLNPISICVEV